MVNYKFQLVRILFECIIVVYISTRTLKLYNIIIVGPGLGFQLFQLYLNVLLALVIEINIASANTSNILWSVKTERIIYFVVYSIEDFLDSW